MCTLSSGVREEGRGIETKRGTTMNCKWVDQIDVDLMRDLSLETLYVCVPVSTL